MEFKGTKGKWAVWNNTTTRKGKLGIVISWDENGQNSIEIASVYTSQAEANTKLIAAAPEMFEMLKKIAYSNVFVSDTDLEIRKLLTKITK